MSTRRRYGNEKGNDRLERRFLIRQRSGPQSSKERLVVENPSLSKHIFNPAERRLSVAFPVAALYHQEAWA